MTESLYWVGWSAGSWGTSWGDIPVEDSWDTSQGIARNLANNLKWSFVSDAEAVFKTPQVRTGVNSLQATGDAVQTLPGYGSYAGIGVWGIEVEANGFAQWRGFGCSTGVSLAADGNAFVPLVSRGECKAGGRTLISDGDAAAEATFVVKTTTGTNRVFATGVRNPTDEELAGMITNLLTSKLQHVNVFY